MGQMNSLFYCMYHSHDVYASEICNEDYCCNADGSRKFQSVEGREGKVNES